jgi:hypothetical protein
MGLLELNVAEAAAAAAAAVAAAAAAAAAVVVVLVVVVVYVQLGRDILPLGIWTRTTGALSGEGVWKAIQ